MARPPRFLTTAGGLAVAQLLIGETTVAAAQTICFGRAAQTFARVAQLMAGEPMHCQLTHERQCGASIP